jgi:hypothetical protein
MRFIAAVIAAGLLCSGVTTLAQAPQVYKAELRIIPIQSASARANIDESTSVFAKANATATLTGTKLTVTGSFEGFKSPASVAQIRSGPAMGARGPVVFELSVTKDTKGSMSGTFDLTAEQVTLLRNSRLYVQIHNTNTPEGALWGWFLK